MSRKRDVFQLDNNDTSDADTSDAVGWSRDDGLGYGIPYISIAAVYESLALATTVRNDCR